MRQFVIFLSQIREMISRIVHLAQGRRNIEENIVVFTILKMTEKLR